MTTDRAMIDACIADVHLEIIATMTTLNAIKTNTKDAARRAALIEQYEARIADLEIDHARLIDMELAAEAAEVTDVGVTEVKGSRALERAFRDAEAKTTAIIAGAEGVGRAMERLAPGCMFKTGTTRTWEIVDEITHDTYRLTLAAGATNGVMRFSRFSHLA